MSDELVGSGASTRSARARVRLALIGTGLIGGSLAAALRLGEDRPFITGFAANNDAYRARELGLIDQACASVAEAVDGADWVVLAAPVPSLAALFGQIAPVLASHARLTDCGSTKLSVIQAAREQLGPAFSRYVPGHPIAGSEHSGPDAARPDLFRGRRWVLCPANESQQAHGAELQALLAPTGAIVSQMPAEQHDRLFAEVSHWPHVVAFALGAAIGRGDLAQQAIEFSGGGLRDTSRIAASSPELWAGILLDNAQAVLASGERYRRELDGLMDALATRDRAALLDVLERASQWRRRLD